MAHDPSIPTRPVTIRDIAAAAKVHHATVSRALRNDPRITEAVRMRIQALARKMAYRPNPLVAAFTAQVRNHRGTLNPVSIACLEYYTGPAYAFWQDLYVNGMKSRAGELGFHLERIRFSDTGMSTQRLRTMLLARGIRGLVVLPVPHNFCLEPFDCSGLAMASIGFSLREPAIHRAATDYFQSMRLCIQSLVARGFTRIGCCIAKVDLDRIGERWMGAYACWQRTLPSTEVLPVHVNDCLKLPDPGRSKVRDDEWSDAALDSLMHWFRRAKPDAVICCSGAFWRGFKALGIRFPRELAYASLGVCADAPGASGITQNHEAVGAAAIDLVVGQMHRNDYGIPTHPATMLIRGEWVDGKTL